MEIDSAIGELSQKDYVHTSMEYDKNLIEKLIIKEDKSVKVSYTSTKRDSEGEFLCNASYKGEVYLVDNMPYENRFNVRIGNDPAVTTNAEGASFSVSLNLYQVRTNLDILSTERKEICLESFKSFFPKKYPDSHTKSLDGLRYTVLVFPDFTYEEPNTIIRRNQ